MPNHKSGMESEIVYIPQKLADRLREYIHDKEIGTEKRIFPIIYNAARVMVKKTGKIGKHNYSSDVIAIREGNAAVISQPACSAIQNVVATESGAESECSSNVS